VSAARKILLDHEKSALLIALIAGGFMWYGYGLLKGMLFFLFAFLLPQPVYIYHYWRRDKRLG
jgi:Flp pilus assembly protein TadB